jgi:hypothetical protein
VREKPGGFSMGIVKDMLGESELHVEHGALMNS